MTRNAIEARKLEEAKRRRKQDAVLGAAGLAISGITGGIGSLGALRKGTAALEGARRRAAGNAGHTDQHDEGQGDQNG